MIFNIISMGVNLMVNTVMKLMCGKNNSAVPLTIRDVTQEEDEEVKNRWSRWKKTHESHVLHEVAFRRCFWSGWFSASSMILPFDIVS
jgi:hypothetical protein